MHQQIDKKHKYILLFIIFLFLTTISNLKLSKNLNNLSNIKDLQVLGLSHELNQKINPAIGCVGLGLGALTGVGFVALIWATEFEDNYQISLQPHSKPKLKFERSNHRKTPEIRWGQQKSDACPELPSDCGGIPRTRFPVPPETSGGSYPAESGPKEHQSDAPVAGWFCCPVEV